MKQYVTAFFLVVSLIGAMHLTGCQTEPSAQIPPSTDGELLLLSSSLTDEAFCGELDTIMADAGVSELRRTVFWNHVEQFNQCDGITGLTDGYEMISATQPRYDVYTLQDAWAVSHPEFIGYNCRITAFSLMGDTITVADTETPDTRNLFLDQQALQEDPSALLSEAELPGFLALFSTIQGENTDDSARQAKLVQDEWQRRGITFDDTLSMRLITVFFHNQYSETENKLTIGHAGVLFDCGSEGLYFVEKLAFQAPYQVTRFDTRSAVKEYLMAVYDVEWGQPTARPFILENDSVL